MMIFLGLSIAVISFYAGYQWESAAREILKVKHRAELDEVWEEVKRNRAQVARLIGKE